MFQTDRSILRSEMSDSLHRWAVPEAFGQELALLLISEREPAESSKLWARFEEGVNAGRFPFIRRTGLDRYVFTPEAREEFLQYWRTEKNKGEFKRLNRTLHEYFQARLEEEGRRQSPAPLLFSLLRQSLYHLIAADEARGLLEFEKWFSHYEQAGRVQVCQDLLKAIEQQSADLSSRGQLWLSFYRARLAALQERVESAEGMAAEVSPSRTVLTALLENYNRLRETGAFADPLLEGRIWNLLGIIAFQRGEHETAFQSFREAVRALDEGALVEEAIAISVNLGMALREAGQLESALEVCHSALERAQVIGVASHHIQAALWLNLGMIYGNLALQTDQPVSKTDLEGKTKDYFARAVLAYASLGDRYREGLALALYGRWLMMSTRIEEAIAYLEKALEILKGIGAPEAETVQGWLEICRRIQAQEEEGKPHSEMPRREPTGPFRKGNGEQAQYLCVEFSKEYEEWKLLWHFLEMFGNRTRYSYTRDTEYYIEQHLPGLQEDTGTGISNKEATFTEMVFPQHLEKTGQTHRVETGSLDLVKEGMQAYREGNLERAISSFQDAVEQARRELRPDVEMVALDWLSLSWVMTGLPDAATFATEFFIRAGRLGYEKL